MNLSLMHDSAVSVRLYNPATQQHYTGAGWTTTPGSAQLMSLTADNVGDPDYSRYSGDTGAWPVGDYLIEYVEVSSGAVLSEEKFSPPQTGDAYSSIETLAAVVDAIKADTDFIYSVEGGKWQIIGAQMVFYKADNSTEIARFNLYDNTNTLSATNIAKRERV